MKYSVSGNHAPPPPTPLLLLGCCAAPKTVSSTYNAWQISIVLFSRGFPSVLEYSVQYSVLGRTGTTWSLHKFLKYSVLGHTRWNLHKFLKLLKCSSSGICEVKPRDMIIWRSGFVGISQKICQIPRNLRRLLVELRCFSCFSADNFREGSVDVQLSHWRHLRHCTLSG